MSATPAEIAKRISYPELWLILRNIERSRVLESIHVAGAVRIGMSTKEGFKDSMKQLRISAGFAEEKRVATRSMFRGIPTKK